VALLLSSLYGVNAHVALEYTQALHDSRGNPQGVRSPQTRIQRDQVCPCSRFHGCLNFERRLSQDFLASNSRL